jgi:hypothetical protein
MGEVLPDKVTISKHMEINYGLSFDSGINTCKSLSLE